MNFYKENPALKFQLSHPLMEKIVTLKERNYEDKDKYDYEYVRMSERIYSYFENITDKCRDVVKQIIIVMYKNI